MKRRFLGILICLLAVFLMSHNSSAITLTQDVYIAYNAFNSTMATTSWTCYNDSTCPTWSSGTYVQTLSSYGANINTLYVTIPQRNYIEGDWIVLQFEMNQSRTPYATHSSFLGMNYAGTHSLALVDYDYDDLTDNSALVTVYIRVLASFNDNNLYFTGMSGPSTAILQLQAPANASSPGQFKILQTSIWHERQAVSYNSALQGISSQLDGLGNEIASVDRGINNLNDTIQDQNDKENEAIDNIDGQDTSDIDSGDNTNVVNFIGQISSLFTQIRDIEPASECVISGDLGHIDIGNINFCTGKDKMPFIVNFFSFIFVTLTSLWLAFYLMKRILALYSWARSSDG